MQIVSFSLMAALDPAIHVFALRGRKDLDPRVKPGGEGLRVGDVSALFAPPRTHIEGTHSEIPMRAETYNLVEEIKQSLGLLRRSL